jgi:hypothetical protein
MIEDILFHHSAQRNIHKLRPYLPPNFCEQASDAILAHPGKVFITTGFWVAGTCETDGPIGAIVLADVLRELGSTPIFVADRFCAHILRTCREYQVIDFPITSYEKSRRIAHTLLNQENPSLAISIERCGMSADGSYYNMRGDDISEYTAKLDYLFELFPMSIGIGDGGNEIGMGNLNEAIEREAIPIHPCMTKVCYPVIATVSNWGVYGIVAYLSRKTGQDYLRFLRVGEILKQLIKLGVVDGVLKKPELSVDGFSLSAIERVIEQLSETCQAI